VPALQGLMKARSGSTTFAHVQLDRRVHDFLVHPDPSPQPHRSKVERHFTR
jgi:hypothetical protein